MAKNNLQNHWQRHDWQTSPYAPDLRIVQALVNGRTASGAGFSRYDALSRCMGETAEIIALNADESSEGMAAGPDIAFAVEQALSERLERWALWGWWHGQHIAQPIAADDLIHTLRHGAGEARETSLWLLPGFPYIQVAIARSRSDAGTQPILGFGADICPVKASQSALIELGLMELNLHDPRADLHAYFTRLHDKSNSLFPATPPRALRPTPQTAPLKDSLTDVKFTLHDRTPAGINLVVVKAEMPDAPSWAGTLGPLL